MPDRRNLKINMKTAPALRTARFAQLKPGDLFLWPGICVALKVYDPHADEHVILPIGPSMPNDEMTYPTLIRDPGLTVASFGRDYCVRLPPDASGWESSEPAPELTSLAVSDSGGVFIRCNHDTRPRQFRPCYVDLSSGEICMVGTGRSGSFARPAGTLAYATQWELLTCEDPPRTILSLPFVGDASAP